MASTKFQKLHGDLDIDVASRDQLLQVLTHIPASKIKDNVLIKHNTGVYVQEIPIEPISGQCSLDFHKAEELGYMKFDFLNLGAYESIKTDERLQSLIEKEPNWSLLLHQDILDKLYQVKDHIDILKQMQPKSIKELAMVLALIRPGKRYLLGKSWQEIEKEIWIKNDDAYAFRHGHATAYSMMIVMQLNLIEEEMSK